MATPKRKVTLSLDGAALDELQASSTGASLSSLVDSAVADRVALVRQRQALNHLLGEFEAEHGPLDEAEILAAMHRMTARA